MVLLPTDRMDGLFSPRCVWVNGPIIVGAGPAGLAVAACLREQGVPYVVLEGEDSVASVWKKRPYDYDRPKLFERKELCELPRLPFPKHLPEFLTAGHLIDYLEQYAARFEVRPEFNCHVRSARYDENSGLWRVRTHQLSDAHEMEYIGRWLVVATRQNAESKIPYIPGLSDFGGEVTHVSNYRCGESYAGKRVLVVGSGSSGMDVSLDLCNHGARPSMVARDAVHVLPREVAGQPTMDLAVLLMRWLPLWLVDKILVLVAWLLLGDLAKLGFARPTAGPLQVMHAQGRVPVLIDNGAVASIRAGHIHVVPAVVRFTNDQFELIDGRAIDVDAVILATGYHGNMPQWLQDADFPHGWKGQCGLYAFGSTKRGLSAASADAVRIAKDLGNVWREETKPTKRVGARLRRCCAVVF